MFKTVWYSTSRYVDMLPHRYTDEKTKIEWMHSLTRVGMNWRGTFYGISDTVKSMPTYHLMPPLLWEDYSIFIQWWLPQNAFPRSSQTTILKLYIQHKCNALKRCHKRSPPPHTQHNIVSRIWVFPDFDKVDRGVFQSDVASRDDFLSAVKAFCVQILPKLWNSLLLK